MLGLILRETDKAYYLMRFNEYKDKLGLDQQFFRPEVCWAPKSCTLLTPTGLTTRSGREKYIITLIETDWFTPRWEASKYMVASTPQVTAWSAIRAIKKELGIKTDPSTIPLRTFLETTQKDPVEDLLTIQEETTKCFLCLRVMPDLIDGVCAFCRTELMSV